MDYITGTHVVNTIYKHTVNLPKYLINLFLWITKSKKRVEFDYKFFRMEIKLKVTLSLEKSKANLNV
jgi:hypothetical protein